VESGAPLPDRQRRDIARIHSVGLGQLEAASNEHAKLRRVTVRLMVNPTD